MSVSVPDTRVPQRYYFSAACMDGGFFLIMVAIPFKVLALGGGSLALGLVPAAISITYIIFSQLAGLWSDHHDPNRLCLIGNLLLIIATVLAYPVQQLWSLLALASLMGVGKALYWPVIQATIGELSKSHQLIQNTGILNVSWSTGKALGFFIGGVLLAKCGFKVTFLTGATVVAIAFLLLPRQIGKPVSSALDVKAAEPIRTTKSIAVTESNFEWNRNLFRHMSWLGNIGAYGAFGILNYHLPQFFSVADWNENRFGIFLALVLVVQTLVFLLLIKRVHFAYSLNRLWIPQLLILVVLLAIPRLGNFGYLLAISPLLGIGLGFCYTASMFYSLDTNQGKGRNAGIHESLIGVGSFLPPLLGGLAANSVGRLDIPYYLGAVSIAVLLGIQILLWLRANNKHSNVTHQKGTQ